MSPLQPDLDKRCDILETPDFLCEPPCIWFTMCFSLDFRRTKLFFWSLFLAYTTIILFEHII